MASRTDNGFDAGVQSVWASGITASNDARGIREPSDEGINILRGFHIAFSRLRDLLPPRGVFNWFFRRHDALAKDVNEFGAWLPWDSTITYKAGAHVIRPLGGEEIGFKAVRTNTNVDPATDSDASDWARAVPAASVPAATTSVSGIAQFADNDDADAGTSSSVMVSPSIWVRMFNRRAPSWVRVTATKIPSAKLDLATSSDATTGSDNTKPMTALRTREAIDGRVPSATELTEGKVRKASNTDVTTGTDDSKFVTPAALTNRANALDDAKVIVPSNANLEVLSGSSAPAANSGNTDRFQIYFEV